MLAQPCSAIMKKSSQIGARESQEGCYVMAGHQLKFEPGLLKHYKDREPRGGNMTQKDIFKTFSNLTHSKQSFSQAMDLSDPKYVQQLKQLSTARRQLLHYQM